MARKRPATKSSGAKRVAAAAKSRAAKKPAKKANKTAKAAKAAKKAAAKKAAAKKASTTRAKTSGAKKARAGKAMRKSVAKKAVKKAGKKAAKKISTRAQRSPAAAKRDANKALPAARRSTPRISAGRRATKRTASSREALAKKTLAKPAAARKPAKKRPAERAPATKAAGKAAGKTARSRLVVRAAQKQAAPVLRDGARRRVVKPTAPRRETAPAPGSRAPFRLHSLGVRDEHATDRPRVEALLVDAFGRPDEAGIVERLRADGDIVLALVAEYESEIVGHIAFSRVRAEIDGREVRALALAPLAVSPARQGKGVGSVLVAAGVEAARTAGFEAVFVVGDAAFYGRFGFTTERAAVFESNWREFLLALELQPDSLSGNAGTLEHPAALLR